MQRRDSLKLLVLGGAAIALPGCTPSDVERASNAVLRRDPDGSFSSYTWSVFSESEKRTLTVLTDDIIPADDRSGSASQARVPEFIDFMTSEYENLRTPLLGGLAWLDRECHRAYRSGYADCSLVQRHDLLDRIAWPEVAAPTDAPGAAFFTLVRDLTASGFWTSEMGMQDVGFRGNIPNPVWSGCTPEALAHASRVKG